MIRPWIEGIGNLSIKYKLFLSYLGLILIPLVVFLLVNTFVTGKENEKEMIYSARQVLKQTNSYLEFKTKSAVNTLNMLVLNEDIQELIQVNSERYVNDIGRWIIDADKLNAQFLLAKNNPDISYVRIYMKQGLASFAESNELKDLSRYDDAPWFSLLSTTHIEWFDKRYFKETDAGEDDFMHVLRNIPSHLDLHQSIGVAELGIPQSQIQLILDQTIYTPDTTAALINSRSEIVGTAGTGQNLGISDTALSVLPAFAKDNLSNGILKTLDYNEEKWLVGAQEVEDSDWTLMLITPYSDIMSLSNKSRKPMIAVFLIIAMIALPLSFLAASSAVKRIKALIHQMRKVVRGNYEMTSIPSSQDEIGELVRNFQHMLSTIGSSIDERYRLGKEIKTLELRALQAQINPHFLYNTLDLINWMSVKHAAPEIGEVARALSRFYKLSLSKGEDTVTIRSELAHVQAYVQIQNMRFQDGIRLDIDVPDSLLDHPILKIALQPIVENAIIHGILEKEDETGTIMIRGEQIADLIVLYVQDDGVGMSEETAGRILSGETPASRESGYGLKNINERLQIHYGDKYGLAFQSALGEGTTVIVRLPAVES
ncbi:two-component system, sensor histidine kinase YesM [Cohnella sp. OV330]|uniref:cache domain-containing sensor histidine kinase n=1 Tax=Cohnella sp. OV330 TaxID=1855288 RepID=UPI0008F122D0|nr:sensor histidine kinase [Cohnella sp. OV330]SFB56394.1 two-component system, sensor histidine kinase YesM [Cohnella sp. OV330]